MNDQEYEVFNDGIAWIAKPAHGHYRYFRRASVGPAPIPCVGATWKYTRDGLLFGARRTITAVGTEYVKTEGGNIPLTWFTAGTLTYVSGPTGHEVACNAQQATVRVPKAGDTWLYTALAISTGMRKIASTEITPEGRTLYHTAGRASCFALDEVQAGKLEFVSDAPKNLAEGTAQLPERARNEKATPSPKPLQSCQRVLPPHPGRDAERGAGIAALKFEPRRSGVSALELQELAMWPRRKR